MGPKTRENVISLAAEEQVIRLGRWANQVDDGRLGLRVGKLPDPSPAIEPITSVFLGTARTLHDAIERQMRKPNKLSHIRSSPKTRFSFSFVSRTRSAESTFSTSFDLIFFVSVLTT